MISLFRHILSDYWQVLCFKRTPIETPKSTTMLVISFFLALSAMLLEYACARFMHVTTLSFTALGFSFLVQIGLIAIYIRILLWVHQNSSDFLAFLTCWLMMMFFLDLIASMIMGLIISLQAIGLTHIFSISFLKVGMVLAIVLSLWQVTYIVYLLANFLRLTFWQAFIYYLGWLLLNYIYLWVLKTF